MQYGRAGGLVWYYGYRTWLGGVDIGCRAFPEAAELITAPTMTYGEVLHLASNTFDTLL